MAGYALTLRNDRLQKIIDDVGATGRLLIYAGIRPATAQPATGALLVTIPLKSPIGTILNAVLTFDKPDDVQATGSGTATWARIDNGTTATPQIDLSLSDTTGNGEVKLNTTTITTGLFISAQSIQVTEGN